MTKLLLLLLISCASLAFVAAAVFGLDDATLFVSPPEARAEGFIRSIETGRYVQAKQYLSNTARGHTSIVDLERLRGEIVSSVGEVQNVTGKRLRIEGDEAEADAILHSRHRRLSQIRVRLVRESGEWNVGHFRMDTRASSRP